MNLPEINFNIGRGGLGRPPANQDHVSALVFYTANGDLPTGFTTSDRIKTVFSVQDAEDLGITSDYSDNTAASGSYAFSNAGATGDTFEIFVNEPTGLRSLGLHTRTAAQTTTTLLAEGVRDTINLGTQTHGYSATASTGTLSLTAPKKFGIFLNSGSPISVTINGTIAGTITQFSSGTFSKLAIFHYHISEFFRLKPNGKLYVAFYAAYGTNFEEVKLVQDFALGEIRQIAVFNDLSTAYANTQVTKLQTQYDAMLAQYRQASILFAPEISGTASVASLLNASLLDSEGVSVTISQDGAAQGWLLWKATGKSITDLGAKLGVLAASKVSESWAWVGQYNMSDGTELDVVNFSNGQLYTAISQGLLEQLNTYAYCFLRKLEGITGTYNNQPNTATLASSDYRFIYANRTLGKAIRTVRANTLPALSGPVDLNADGTLTNSQVAYYESLGNAALDQMVRDGELSAGETIVDPTTNVLSTNNINESIKLLPKGVADFITVNIGYVTSL